MQDDQRDKIVTLLQFAHKANKIIFGHDAVLRGVRSKKVDMIICAEDLSENTKKSIIKHTENVIIDIFYMGTISLFESLFGKAIGIIGVSDISFGKGIKKHFCAKETEV
ncbi:MAG: ribosomal L7Ae/L30e/S12e/Gadd45 family protein [Candidatus Cloacimonetes bacterium]|nr:ribosomal L7Ae/L30e/S12e/Gadd45 family protein [Candidatus Cloacimonadota bacterium]